MKRIVLAVLGVVAVVGGALGFVAYQHLLKKEPQPTFQSEEEHFKYASVGVEEPQGVPFWIWKVLPALCRDHLKDPDAGYAGYGFIFEDGHDSPVGMPKVAIGFPRLGINCAMCHTATVDTEGGKPRLLVGAPSNTLDLEGYLRFLFACTADPRFNPDNVLAEIEKVHELGITEKLVYRLLVVGAMKKAVQEQREQLAFMDKLPDYGPGRTASFNPAKGMILGLAYDGSNDTTDIMSLWNWKARQGHSLHWGGEQNSLHEVFLNSGIGNGASPKSIRVDNLERMERFVTALEPPKYPFPIDATLVGKGRELFDRECASCHAFGAAKTGQVIALDEAGTDRKRLDAFTPETAEGFKSLDVYAWRYLGFRKTHGYKADALDGIWARAPYLHNGAVPTLRDLLEPMEKRPKVFYRGSGAYDQVKVGFVSEVAQAQGRKLARYDTSLSGNANTGHLYGVGLAPEEKDALVEYMKSL